MKLSNADEFSIDVYPTTITNKPRLKPKLSKEVPSPFASIMDGNFMYSSYNKFLYLL